MISPGYKTFYLGMFSYATNQWTLFLKSTETGWVFSDAINVVITDSLNKVVKSFNSYVPINYLTNKYQIDLSWCVVFYDYPGNLRKAQIVKPDIVDKQGTKLDVFHFYDNQSRLEEFFYIGSKISGIKPETMKLEYFHGTTNIKKITDSKDGSNYNFEYDDNGNIWSIDYFTVDNKRISQLKIIE
ncbi:MAG TPA: hypothetical protein PK110_11890 [Niabella sp.]|nr:hypothetical protein [Niabella sp.]